jgi:uncharacterized repeat protein (TIGR03803 family)
MTGPEQRRVWIWRTALASVFLLAFAMVGGQWARAQTFKVLHTFHRGKGPQGPLGQLILDQAGNLYGVSSGGGKPGCFKTASCGTAFKMDKSGRLLWVYQFNGWDGFNPYAGLLHDPSGNLYGITEYGGLKTKACGGAQNIGCGVAFKLNPEGNKETVLHRFTGGSDGQIPEALLIQTPAGNLYGTTYGGGENACGTVFRMNEAGKESALYQFKCGVDGAYVFAGVIRDSTNNLYGTTGAGGYLGCDSGGGCGTVYRLDSSGKETVLYDFTWRSDGAFPSSGLIRDAAGNLYGETKLGGNLQVYDCDGLEGCGVVYELSPNGSGGWTETTLYMFNESDGFEPFGGLVRDAHGNLYGVTTSGGENGSNCNGGGCGVVFKLDTGGNETVLHSFTGGADGAFPQGGLVMDALGNLYGTALQGGDFNCAFNQIRGCGVVFKITP